MAAFQREIKVRFGACDPAAIVYYPRYFEMISNFIEDWFEEGLDASVLDLMNRRGILIPTVHFTVDFPRPSRFGDRLTFALAVRKIGRSSCQIRIKVSCQREIRLTTDQVLVFVDATRRDAMPIPGDIAKRMRRFMSAACAPRAAAAQRAAKKS